MTDTTYWPFIIKKESKSEHYATKSPNPDFNPPPTTGSNAIPPAAKGSAIRKCPFRKSYHPERYHKENNNWTITALWDADRITEEFQDCIRQECALWTPLGCKG